MRLTNLRRNFFQLSNSNHCSTISKLILFATIFLEAVSTLNEVHLTADPPGTESNLYILLLGTSGCGKSSTINFLLNQTVAAIGESDSTTSAIHEYSVQISSTSLNNITFIDTPGFGDTRGLEYDARFLASLQHFLERHEELSERVPDLVLLCNRYDDNRFNGDGAVFVKMLKGVGLLSDLWLANEGGPVNTALLLTHYGNGESALASANKIQQYRQVLKEFTRFPQQMHVILAENKVQDFDPEFDNNVRPSAVGRTQDLYPNNLWKWFKTAVSNNTAKVTMIDELSNARYFSVEESRKFGLISINDSKTENVLHILANMNLKTDVTPISVKLSAAFQTLTAQGERFQADTLGYLQKALNLQRIINTNDVPLTNMEITKLFRNLRIDGGVLKLLKTAFEIEPPELPDSDQFQAGFNYNTLRMEILKESLYDMRTLESSNLGYKIPKPISCSYAAPESGSKLRVRRTWIPDDSALNKKSVKIEFQFIHCKLKDTNQIKTTFIDSLQRLPKFDEHDYGIIKEWKQFLDNFGSHIVTETYLGASIHLSQLPAEWETLSADDLLANLKFSRTTFKLRQSGGSHAFSSTCSFNFFTRKLYQSWLKSIQQYPTPLKNFEIKPIDDCIRMLNQSAATEFVNARIYFLNKPKGYDLEESIITEMKRLEAEVKKFTESEQLSKTALNDKNTALTNCNTVKDTTLSQNYEITTRLATSENTVRDVSLQLVSAKNENTGLNSENEHNKILLTTVRAEVTKEQAHSHQLNNLVSQCDGRANGLQLSLNSCNTEKEEAASSCQRNHGHHHHHRQRHGHGHHRHGQ